MEASTRLLVSSPSLTRRLLLSRPTLRNPNPRFIPLKLQSCHRHGPRASVSSPSNDPRKPFLSLSSTSHRVLSSSNQRIDRHNLGPGSEHSPFDRAREGSAAADLGLCVGGNAGEWTVVLLGWLGAEEKHLRRYAEMYSSKRFRTVTFVVPVRETVGLDLCKNVEDKIENLAMELARWCKESDKDGKERHLIFHTFSNTGWLAYGVLLQSFQSRDGIIEKIKGCIVDSAPSAEICPQVWAAGYYAALLKKRSPLVEPVESDKLDGRKNRLNAQDIIPALVEIIVLKVLEIFFSLALMLPYAKQRLSSIISTLKDQPPYPQLYLYSTADKVIPASVIECFLKEQKALGRSVHAHDFGSSPHVDHLRSFPHLYSAKVNEFLKHCCSTVVSKT